MRSRACAVLVLAAAVAGVVADAASAEVVRYTRIPFESRGSLTVTWHGDPAAGCAAAGLCGYHGVTTYPPAHAGSLEMLRVGREIVDIGGELKFPGHPVARAIRDVPGAARSVCVDRGDTTFFPLEASHAYRGHWSIELGADIYPGGIASGRCGGPTFADIAPRLPSVTFMPARLLRRGVRLNLAGRFPFRAGAFVGEVVSTLELRTRRSRTRREREYPGGPETTERTVFVDMRYAVTRLRGAVTADFRAIEPACAALDACGATGREQYTLAAAGGEFEVFGAAPWHRRARPTLKQALAHLVNHGFLFGYSYGARPLGEATDSFLRPGAEPCRDRLRPTATPNLNLDGRRGRLELALGYGADAGAGESIDDVLGGRCPGPTQAQIFGPSPLARLRLSPSDLARRRVELLLRSGGTFSRGGYRGTRGAQVEVSLKRTGAQVHLGRGSGFGGGGTIAVIGASRSGAQRP